LSARFVFDSHHDHESQCDLNRVFGGAIALAFCGSVKPRVSIYGSIMIVTDLDGHSAG